VAGVEIGKKKRRAWGLTRLEETPEKKRSLEEEETFAAEPTGTGKWDAAKGEEFQRKKLRSMASDKEDMNRGGRTKKEKKRTPRASSSRGNNYKPSKKKSSRRL